MATYFEEIWSRQHFLYSNLKKTGYIPEPQSEIIVKNIPSHVSIMDLLEFFQEAGDVYQIRLMLDDEKRYNREFAFVQYTTTAFANNALTKLSNKTFLHYGLLSLERSMNNCRIFLAGIPISKTKQQVLYELRKRLVRQVVDVNLKRGYAFVEFRTHEAAARFKAKYTTNPLIMWNRIMRVDWSNHVPNESTLKVIENRVIFLRNLDLEMTYDDLVFILTQFMERSKIEKIYKFKDYAFVHFTAKLDAEYMHLVLNEYFKGTFVDVLWKYLPVSFGHINSVQWEDETKIECFSPFTYEPTIDDIILSIVDLPTNVIDFIGDIL